jgi:hypothetical protein
MSETGAPDPEDLLEPPDPQDALPPPNRRGHGKMPDGIDDDALALAVARERVAMGLADYVPEDVPPATDPLPEGSSEAADLAQRGILEGDDDA